MIRVMPNGVTVMISHRAQATVEDLLVLVDDTYVTIEKYRPERGWVTIGIVRGPHENDWITNCDSRHTEAQKQAVQVVIVGWWLQARQAEKITEPVSQAFAKFYRDIIAEPVGDLDPNRLGFIRWLYEQGRIGDEMEKS